MYGRISDAGMGPCDLALPGWRWLCESQVGVSTQFGTVSARVTIVFVSSLLELKIYERISHPGMEPYPARVALAPRIPGWGFHNVRSGIDPGDQPFRPRYGKCRCMEGFLIRVWHLILPGWRWHYE